MSAQYGRSRIRQSDPQPNTYKLDRHSPISHCSSFRLLTSTNLVLQGPSPAGGQRPHRQSGGMHTWRHTHHTIILISPTSRTPLRPALAHQTSDVRCPKAIIHPSSPEGSHVIFEHNRHMHFRLAACNSPASAALSPAADEFHTRRLASVLILPVQLSPQPDSLRLARRHCQFPTPLVS